MSVKEMKEGEEITVTVLRPRKGRTTAGIVVDQGAEAIARKQENIQKTEKEEGNTEIIERGRHPDPRNVDLGNPALKETLPREPKKR